MYGTLPNVKAVEQAGIRPFTPIIDYTRCKKRLFNKERFVHDPEWGVYGFDEEYHDRVRSYRGTLSCEKALCKRKAWARPLFAEAKEWHGVRKMRLRTLERVNAEVRIVPPARTRSRC